jgi:uncharacterized protein (TIGR00725 family)
MPTHKTIGVIGAGACDEATAAMAYEVGQGIAKAGYTLICGGLGGVMEAACRGACDAGGLTVGILPGDTVAAANPYVKIPIATGLGIARNVIIVRSSRVLIAVSGGPGTLSEIAFALQLRVPVVSVKSFSISEEVIQARDPEHALQRALEFAERPTGANHA